MTRPAPSTTSPAYSTRRSASELSRRPNAATAPRKTASAAQPNAAKVAEGWLRAMRPTRSPVIARAVRSAPSAGSAASRNFAAPWASFPTGRNLGMSLDATTEALRNHQRQVRETRKAGVRPLRGQTPDRREGEAFATAKTTRPASADGRASLPLLEGRVSRARALLLAPPLRVPGRPLARRVVDEAADRRLVDEVRRPLEERDHRHVVR